MLEFKDFSYAHYGQVLDEMIERTFIRVSGR